MEDEFLTIEDGIVTECKKSAVNVVIPSGVKEIGFGAFKECAFLESVVGGTQAQWEEDVHGKEFLLDYVPAKVVKCSDGELT